MKKLICSVLALCISVGSSVPIFSADTDAAESNEYELLEKLGIIDEAYDIGGNVSRGEFAEMISAFFEDNEYDFSNMNYYSDVDKGSEYANAINKGTYYGIFQGVEANRKFEAESPILLDHAAVALVRLLGYEIAVGNGTFVGTANKIGLYKGIKSDTGVNENLLIMINNALEIKVMEPVLDGSGDSYRLSDEYDLLLKVFGVRKIKGVVNAVGAAALTSFNKTESSQIRIGDRVFEIDEADRPALLAKLGMTVEAYYKDDDSMRLLCAEDKGDDYVEIDLADYDRLESGKLTYYDGDRLRELKIDNYTYIVYNNEPRGAMPAVGNNGTMRLISNGGNSEYNVIIIKEYTDYIVSEYVADKNVILMKYTNESINLNNYEGYAIYDANGEIMKPQDIKEGAVLSAASNANEIELVYSEKRLGAVLEEIETERGNKYITAKGQKYMLSERINNASATNFNINLYTNKEIYLTFNILGNVCGITAVEAIQQYGYIVWAKRDLESDNLICKMYTSDGTFERLSFRVKNEQITVDGEKRDIDVFLGGFSPSIVSYNLNSSSQITKISFPATTAEAPKDGIYLMKAMTSGQRYRSDVLSFGGEAILSKNATIFAIPDDISDETSYRVASPGFFRNDASYTNISFYGTDKNSIAAPIAVWKVNKASTYKGQSMVVTSVIRTVNEDNEPIDIIKGIGTMNSKEMEYVGAAGVDLITASETAVDVPLTPSRTISKGDIIRGDYSSVDYDIYYSTELLYDASESEWLPTSAGIEWNDYDAIRYGKIDKFYDGYLRYKSMDEAVQKVYKEGNRYIVVEDGGGSVYVGDGTVADIAFNSSEVVFYDNYDRMRWMVIYK